MSWVKVEQIKGGQLVLCALCGRHVCRLTFWAKDTNHAEAFRLAVAYAWQHEHGDIHRAAVEAFHSKDVPTIRAEERLLGQIFGGAGYREPDEKELRKRAARTAALAALRRSKGQ